MRMRKRAMVYAEDSRDELVDVLSGMSDEDVCTLWNEAWNAGWVDDGLEWDDMDGIAVYFGNGHFMDALFRVCWSVSEGTFDVDDEIFWGDWENKLYSGSFSDFVDKVVDLDVLCDYIINERVEL